MTETHFRHSSEQIGRSLPEVGVARSDDENSWLHVSTLAAAPLAVAVITLAQRKDDTEHERKQGDQDGRIVKKTASRVKVPKPLIMIAAWSLDFTCHGAPPYVTNGL